MSYLKTFNFIYILDGPCEFNVAGSLRQPIFLESNHWKFLRARETGKHKLQPGEEIRLYCRGAFMDQLAENSGLVTVACHNNKFFNLKNSDKRFNIETMRCTNIIEIEFTETNENCAGGHGKIIKVGYHLTHNRHTNDITVLEVCFNKAKKRTYWSFHKQHPTVKIGYSGRGQFHSEEYYPAAEFEISKMYEFANQQATFKAILGNNDNNVRPLLENTQKKKLSRGHLAAANDFDTFPEVHCAMHFMNIVPQYERQNNVIWSQVESYLHYHVDKDILNVDIFTGAHGILQGRANNAMHDLYLARSNVDHQLKIPVPAYIYKVIVDRNSNRGIVFINVNRPDVEGTAIPQEYVLCQNIIGRLKASPKIEHSNLDKGAVYACSVTSFLRAFGTDLRGLPQRFPNLASKTEILFENPRAPPRSPSPQGGNSRPGSPISRSSSPTGRGSSPTGRGSTSSRSGSPSNRRT